MLHDLIADEKKSLYLLEDKFHKLNSDSSLSSEFSLSLDKVELRLKDIENLVHKEGIQQRQQYSSRLSQLNYTFSNLKESYNSYLLRQSKNNPAMQRMQFYNNFNSINTGPNIYNANSTGTDSDAYSLEMAENGALTRSSRMLASYIEQGELSLQELLNQKDRLKLVKKKTLDILNYLGLSRSILSKVEKRDNIDAIIVLVGCVFILALMFFVYFFVRK